MNVESNEIEKLLVGHLGEKRFCAFDDIAGKAGLVGDHLIDLFLDGSTTYEFMYQHASLLSNPERTISSLVFNGGVPPAVEVNDLRRGGEVEPRAAGLEGKDEEGRPIFALKTFNEPPTLCDWSSTVQHQAGPPEDACQKLGERAGDLAKLCEDQGFLLPLGKLFAKSRQALKLAAVLGVVIAGARDLGRMVADLLQPHELGQNKPAPRHAVGGFELLGQVANRLLDRARPVRG